jgi:hypothetical protein
MASTVSWIRLSPGIALGLTFGYSIRRAVRRVHTSGRVTFEPAASPALALVSALAAIWILSVSRSASPYVTSAPRGPRIVLTDAIHLLSVYCVSSVMGFLGFQRYPVPEKRWIVVLLDVFVFGTLGYQFAVRVLRNGGVPLSELPVYQGGRLIVTAAAFGLLVTIVHHCALTGKWPTNILTAVSTLSLVCLDVPRWLEVMRRGFAHMDMAQAFVHGLDQFLVSLLVWPVSLALGIGGLIVAHKQTDRYAVAASLAQLGLLGLKPTLALLCLYIPGFL